MEFVIFRFGGKQYKAKVGDIVEVDKVPSDENKSIELSDVLFWSSEKEIKIGKPTLGGAKIKAFVLGHKKGEKIRVAKYKAKVRYRKVIGFRPHKTDLRIDDFSLGPKKAN